MLLKPPVKEVRIAVRKLGEPMTDDPEPSDGWTLTDRDRRILAVLGEAVRGLVRLARSGRDLIALGEAWDAIERIRGGETIDVNVGISVGFRRGDKDFEERRFVCLRINDEEIVLDELNATYSSDMGSDHHTDGYAVLRPGGGYDEIDVSRWIRLLDEMRSEDGAKLRTERDHV